MNILDNKSTVMVVEGVFNSVSVEFIKKIKELRKGCDFLAVALYSDKFLSEKMFNENDFESRKYIMQSIDGVGFCFESEVDEELTKKKIKNLFPNRKINLVCIDPIENIENTSEKSRRPWGYFRTINDYGNTKNVKVKELVVFPGKSLSLQKHAHRNEQWFIVSGEGSLTLKNNIQNSSSHAETIKLEKFKKVNVPVEYWHQLSNTSEHDILIIVEIQYGEFCKESDIERKL